VYVRITLCSFFLLILQTPIFSLFTYTTLFRSPTEISLFQKEQLWELFLLIGKGQVNLAVIISEYGWFLLLMFQQQEHKLLQVPEEYRLEETLICSPIGRNTKIPL